MESKHYLKCSSEEIVDLYKGYVGKYPVPDEMLTKLSRDLGFSFETYNTISAINQDLSDTLIKAMSRKSQHEEIAVLVDESKGELLGYALDTARLPVLNEEFLKRVRSLVETSDAIRIDELYEIADDVQASILIKKVSPIKIDLGSSEATYEIGVLVVNNELDSTYCRLVIYVGGQPVYLPSIYYNASSNRYKKSTGNSVEALEVLILKVIDDLREDALREKVQDFHLKYRVNKDVLTSYEEYNTLLRTMMKIPSIIDDRSLLSKLMELYDDFEQKYAQLETSKSSYIWRCTAIADLPIGSLMNLTSSILGELGAPAMEYYQVRELIGNYLSTPRLASEIALGDR